MKIRALQPFKDAKADVIREKGDEFEVEQERYKELVAGLPENYVEVVEDSAAETEAEAVETTEEKTPTKKTKE